jgi:hypothetical protein
MIPRHRLPTAISYCFVLFLFFFTLGCSKKEVVVNADIQRKIQMIMDSVRATIPQSMKFDLDNNIVTLVNKDGSVVKRKFATPGLSDKKTTLSVQDINDEQRSVDVQEPSGTDPTGTSLLLCHADYTVSLISVSYPSGTITSVYNLNTRPFPPSTSSTDQASGTKTTISRTVIDEYNTTSSYPDLNVTFYWDGQIYYRITVEYPGSPPQTVTEQHEYSASKLVNGLTN